MTIHGVEELKIVQGTPPVTTSSAVTCDYVSLKNVKKARIVVHLTQAAAHATGIDPVQASAVAGTGKKALTVAVPIWYNEDTAASDTLTKATSAVTYNVTADIKNKIVIFDIDPAYLDQANGFDCLGCTLDASSEATNFVCVEYQLEMRYPADNTAVITD